ncbi:MAG: 16S rRNA (cytosine(1402)-N(4))-methyltransferase RsmH [Candidatus Levybacteria bacterium]|nr:16S rRNA (cytosine(1402)-N(4))-methyltransferase RsmH [Candidatus Levybacteria bacterium]
MDSFHTSVLLKEIISGLNVQKNKNYIDATIGGGGHSFEILRLGGIVLGIDCDKDAIDYVGENWKLESKRCGIPEKNLILVKGNFRDLDKIAHLNNFDKISGIIFDLGVSSHQLGAAQRGFSFQKEGPLDMRMDQDLNLTAKDFIYALTKGELYELFTKLGEESNAREFSNLIVMARGVKPIETTRDLAMIFEKIPSRRVWGINRATKIFQALRIAVNDELNAIREALPKAVNMLEDEGRILVISFHSLEDRIVKRAFLEFEEKNMGKIITKKPITPTKEELGINRRSRSAKLRIFERNI